MMKNHPRSREVYTPEQIDQLYLYDSPFLMVELDGDFYPIQVQGMDIGEALRGLEFRFIRTTDESIPIFHCISPLSEVKKLITFTVDIDPYLRSGTHYDFWLSIKAYPELPFYRLTEKGTIEDGLGTCFLITPAIQESIDQAEARLAKALS